MKCPIDQSVLQITDRQGVEIDYCPSCRGVWLDRGELDKIIDRIDSGAVPQQPEPSRATRQEYSNDSHQYGQGGYKKRRKEGLLGELFDF
ncbi:zf-TFIIB domain-containing protein [Patescibacteria group bacterium]|nr:zf-TFIIB domain-containing protein [Patescibacteria group bacterium]MBU1755203.1 zf-TFIIB domain-containing protein [Patescibacteria group bacterium]